MYGSQLSSLLNTEKNIYFHEQQPWFVQYVFKPSLVKKWKGTCMWLLYSCWIGIEFVSTNVYTGLYLSTCTFLHTTVDIYKSEVNFTYVITTSNTSTKVKLIICICLGRWKSFEIAYLCFNYTLCTGEWYRLTFSSCPEKLFHPHHFVHSFKCC